MVQPKKNNQETKWLPTWLITFLGQILRLSHKIWHLHLAALSHYTRLGHSVKNFSHIAHDAVKLSNTYCIKKRLPARYSLTIWTASAIILQCTVQKRNEILVSSAQFYICWVPKTFTFLTCHYSSYITLSPRTPPRPEGPI